VNHAKDEKDAARPKHGMDSGIAWTLVAIGVLLTIALVAVFATENKFRLMLALGPLCAAIGITHLKGIYGTRRGHAILTLVALATIGLIVLWNAL
jgi:hypothetical protein